MVAATETERIPICHTCGMGYSCPEHDPGPESAAPPPSRSEPYPEQNREG